MDEGKKNIAKIVLQVIKYIVTLALGALGGGLAASCMAQARMAAGTRCLAAIFFARLRSLKGIHEYPYHHQRPKS